MHNLDFFFFFFKDNGGVIKDGVLNKKYEEKRVNQACTKASNPYHECNENCVKRNAGAEGREGIKEPGSPPFLYRYMYI